MSDWYFHVVPPDWVEEGTYLNIEWKRCFNGDIYIFDIQPYIHIFNIFEFHKDNPGSYYVHENNVIYFREFKGEMICPSLYYPGAYYVKDNVVWEKIIEKINEYRVNLYKPGSKMYKKNEKRIKELTI